MRIPLYFRHWTIGSLSAELLLALQDLRPPLLAAATAASPAMALLGHDLESSLQAIQSWLCRRRLAPPAGNECLDVLAGDGTVLPGRVDRALARILGMRMRSAHLLVVDGKAVWLQRRALTKSADPGLWDTTVGGTCTAGETLETTLEREMFEEAGLRPEQLGPLQSFLHLHLERPAHFGAYAAWQDEQISVWIAVLADRDWTPCCHDGEVMEFRRIVPAAALSGPQALVLTREARAVLGCTDLQQYLAQTH